MSEATNDSNFIGDEPTPPHGEYVAVDEYALSLYRARNQVAQVEDLHLTAWKHWEAPIYVDQVVIIFYVDALTGTKLPA